MRFYQRKPTDEVQEKGTPDSTSPADTPARRHSDGAVVPAPEGRVPAIAVILGAVASIGGFMFGYESGQISGMLLS